MPQGDSQSAGGALATRTRQYSVRNQSGIAFIFGSLCLCTLVSFVVHSVGGITAVMSGGTRQ